MIFSLGKEDQALPGQRCVSGEEKDKNSPGASCPRAVIV